MKRRLLLEWQGLLQATRSLDKQTVCVLVLCVIFVIMQFKLGSRDFFREHVSADSHELFSWGWWFGIQGITGFLVPVAILLFFFRRSPSEIGLGLGDWKLASLLCLLFLPLVVVGTWVLSDNAAFQVEYPHYQAAAYSWKFFLLYHVLFLLYWIGWEYLWRGFVLFGTAHTLGIYAIFVQTIPFALLHLDKPVSELLLSVFGGIALGAVVWRCRSFWIAVPLHAAQMFIIDFWCALRIRTGISGVDFGAFISLMKTWLES